MHRTYIFKKKWLVVFGYRPPRSSNKHTYFELFPNITNTYENFIVTVDLNIDTFGDSMDTNSYLSDFCDTFSLKNSILGKICFKAVSR